MSEAPTIVTSDSSQLRRLARIHYMDVDPHGCQRTSQTCAGCKEMAVNNEAFPAINGNDYVTNSKGITSRLPALAARRHHVRIPL